MKPDEMAQKLNLEDWTPEVAAPQSEVTAGHASDLLSDVLAHAPAGAVLVTIQVHMNVVAVATHCELAAVIFAGGRRPEEPVRQKAAAEGIKLYGSPEPTFEVAGRLYALGVRGKPR